VQEPSPELIAELKSVRKGRGVPDPEFAHRYGPALLAVLDLPEDVPVPEVRTATEKLLRDHAETLADDLKLALLAGFGLHPDARARFYDARADWLAEIFQRDRRTAKRRVDEAVEQVAELALADLRRRDGRTHPTEQAAWHTAFLRTVVVLAGGAPEIIESRRIVCHQPGLDLIDLAGTITGSASPEGRDLDVDVLFGGTLERRARKSGTRTGLYLRLPAAPPTGGKAEFMLRYRIPPGKAMGSHYAPVPRYRCDHYDLRIRFGDDRPASAFRLERVFQADIDDGGAAVPVNRAGEVHLEFDDLVPGFAYGARWEPRDP
jgi:hypothetical protein